MCNNMFYPSFYCPYFFRSPLKCNYCGAEFSTREELRSHIYKSHIDKVYEFIDQSYLQPLSTNGQSEQIYVDSDYLKALKTADKYLYAWITRNGSMAYDLISDNIKKQYKDKEDFKTDFAGLSNPHNEAFEIAGCNCKSKDRIRFKVWMYYHYTGAKPYKRPDTDSYIELIKVNEEKWLVDKVSSSV